MFVQDLSRDNSAVTRFVNRLSGDVKEVKEINEYRLAHFSRFLTLCKAVDLRNFLTGRHILFTRTSESVTRELVGIKVTSKDWVHDAKSESASEALLVHI